MIDRRLFVPLLAVALLAPTTGWSANPANKASPKPVTATPANQLKVAKDFNVERLYSVPKDQYGSWVNLCVDPQGRLITSDQGGGLYRVTPPALGKVGPPKIEKVPADIGEAQGLLWAFDSLYVMVNKGKKYDSGLYRVTSSKNNDTLDKVELLKAISGGGGEHGPHAVLLSPDKQSLHVICGNQTKFVTDIVGSRVPRLWGEDHLLPRMPDGRGFMKDVLAPGGCIYKVDRDGKNWELINNGFRNEFDAAFNREGELFTYDADMEWDFNTPWYRPTRVCHCISGAEWGWRNGAGKWPPYYPDNLPPVVEIGPGSPTGVAFGYGARFPAKYQDAFFICDWSYGKLYAAHLKPHGSTYTGELEEFVSGTPLPLTDIIVNPIDGAMYFTIGGRSTQSGLYRITYTGQESTAPVTEAMEGQAAREIRHKLEAFHGKKNPQAEETAWPYLSHEDRFIRWAARVALEHQDPATWQAKALSETNPQAALTALLALARAGGTDPFHRPKDATGTNTELAGKIFDALEKLEWNGLSNDQRVELARIYQIVLNRYGTPSEKGKKRLIDRFDAVYPCKFRELNDLVGNLMVFLQAPSAAEKTVKLMNEAPTQEEQIEYARALRALKTGWTPELRKQYFTWFVKAAGYKGGNSFGLFVQNIKNDAITTLTDAETAALKPILDMKPSTTSITVGPPRPLVKAWTFEEVVALAENGLNGRDFERGRKMFGAANCFACHRYQNEGGANGPDLTSAAGRFSRRDLIESIVLPSKVISDQYGAVQIQTEDGKVVVGRIVNLHGENLSINTDMLDPNALTKVDRRKIEVMRPSPLSMMPEGMLNTFHEDEILDLLAYLLSRGDRNHEMFKGAK